MRTCASSTARARSSRPASTRSRAGAVLRLPRGGDRSPGRVAPAARARRVAPQGRPDGAGRAEGDRAGRRRHLARGHVPHGRRGPSRPARLAWRALGARRRRAPPSSAGARSCRRSPRPRPWTSWCARAFDGRRVVLLETPGHAPLTSLAIDAAGPLLLLVGPAGGFEPGEAEALRARRLRRGLPRPPHPARRNRGRRRGRDSAGAVGRPPSLTAGRPVRPGGSTPAPAAQ